MTATKTRCSARRSRRCWTGSSPKPRRQPPQRAQWSPTSRAKNWIASCAARPSTSTSTRMRKISPLPISRETGTMLFMLARSSGARSIVEFGTSFAISTLHLAAALRDNGGGRLITTEFEPSKVARAKDNLTAGGVIDLVEIRVGDALKNAEHRSPGDHRSAAARRCEGALSRHSCAGGEPPATGRTHRGRQRGLQPRVPRARSVTREWLFVDAIRRGCRSVDATRLSAGGRRTAHR